MGDKSIDHPAHYGGADNPYEAIKVIEAWDLGFNLGNTVKYISRMGKKEGEPPLRELKKAAFYLAREIMLVEKREREREKKRACDDGEAHAPGECRFCHHVFCIHGTDCGRVGGKGLRCKKCDAVTRRQERRRAYAQSKRIEKKRAATL